MRRLFAILIAFAALAMPGVAQRAVAQESSAWTALKQDGRVALVRHAATSGGAGDPAGFRLDDCATQRNLTERGRAQAQVLGARFRNAGIAVGKVLSSQWCRCQDTARLMDVGAIELAPTFNNAFVWRDRAQELASGARAVIGAWTGPGTLVVVTHGSNILALTGVHPEEAGVVVVEPDRSSTSKLKVIGRVAPES